MEPPRVARLLSGRVPVRGPSPAGTASGRGHRPWLPVSEVRESLRDGLVGRPGVPVSAGA